MRSATSYFKFTVFKKDLARSWPVWTVYTLLWVLLYPVLMLVDRGNSMRWSYAFDLEQWTEWMPLETAASTGMVMLAMVVGLVAAMVTFSYLFNPRACQFAHALPVRREGLFLSHWLAGVAMFAGSHLIVYGLTLVAQAACGGARPGPLAALLGLLTLMCLFFFSFAVLCAALTGHILAMPALYVIFNFLVIGLYYLLSWVVSTFLFGLTWSAPSRVVQAFTPVLALSEWLDWGRTTVEENGEVISWVTLEGIHVVWIYAAVGLVLSLIALLLYRRRQLEMAGEVIAVRPLRPVFRYAFALCTALAGGCTLFAVFGLDDTITFVALMVLWGVIGYYIASMLLAKSFRVFHKWKGAAGVAAAVVLLSGVMSMDLLGLEARVPDPADVAEVTVSGLSSRPYDGLSYLNSDWIDDPEDIALVVALHQAVVDHREELQTNGNGYYYDADHDSTSFEVLYKLNNGLTLRRNYDYFYLSSDGLSDPDSVETALQTLLDDRSFLAGAYGLDEAEGARVVSARLDGLFDAQGNYCQVELWEESYAREVGLIDELGLSTEASASVMPVDNQYYIGTADEASMDAILQAVQSDFDAGALGRRYLFESQMDDSEDGFSNVILRLEWEKTERNEQGRAYTRSGTVEITLTADALQTLTALEAAGAFSQDQVLQDELGRQVWPW